MYVCMYVCMYVYIYIYIHVYIDIGGEGYSYYMCSVCIHTAPGRSAALWGPRCGPSAQFGRR